MRLLLVNPSNPLVSIVRLQESRWNRYRVWQPLSLMALAGLTPPEWDVTVSDENIRVPHYDEMRRPDLVGITAFTSQAPRAYEIAAQFRRLGVPVVMGGIHATMCVDEATRHVDNLNALFLTPLPGTQLWDQMKVDGRIILGMFPHDWQYYTLTFPVARYAHLSQEQAIEEMLACDRHFYALPRILGRALRSIWHRRQPLISLCGGLSYRRNLTLNQEACASLGRLCGERQATRQEDGAIRIPVSPAA